MNTDFDRPLYLGTPDVHSALEILENYFHFSREKRSMAASRKLDSELVPVSSEAMKKGFG